MRISNQQIVDRVLSQIATTQRRLSEVQGRLGSGLRISRPADDPFNTSRILAARTRLDRIQQYDRNAAVALADLAATEGALNRLTELLQRANELSIQAATDSIGADGRSAIAAEVAGLIDAAIAIGNSSHAGGYLFAGQKTDTVPYVPDIPNSPTAVTYDGDSGLIQREIAESTRVAVHITGDRVLPAVFAALIQFRDDLLANDSAALAGAAATFDAQLDAVVGLRSEIGATMRRVELSQTRLEDDRARVRTLLAQIEEADLAQTIVELQMQETAYQAALGSAARTLGVSLMDFLR